MRLQLAFVFVAKNRVDVVGSVGFNADHTFQPFIYYSTFLVCNYLIRTNVMNPITSGASDVHSSLMNSFEIFVSQISKLKQIIGLTRVARRLKSWSFEMTWFTERHSISEIEMCYRQKPPRHRVTGLKLFAWIFYRSFWTNRRIYTCDTERWFQTICGIKFKGISQLIYINLIVVVKWHMQYLYLRTHIHTYIHTP